MALKRLAKRRGLSLAVLLVILTISSLGSLIMTKSLLEQQRLNQRRRDLARSFYAAEAGVGRMLHWSNTPADYVTAGGSPANLFDRTADSRDIDGSPIPMKDQFANFWNAVQGSLTLTESDLHYMGVDMLSTNNGVEVSRIHEIQLLPPDPAAGVAHDFRIRSVGRCGALERTVMNYMEANTLWANPQLALQAALISLDAAGAGGNGKVHWGESWIRGDFDAMNKNDMKYLNSTNAAYDPYAVYRTEGMIDFPNSWNFDTTAPYNPNLLYRELNPAWNQPGLFPDGTGNFAEAFYQNETLDFPDLLAEYETFKQLAQQHGRYYTTDPDGTIRRNGIAVDFVDEFGVLDRDSQPYDTVFIDTLDGNPPAPDGSNLATIQVSGNGEGLKGIYYINANMNVSGVGNPQGLNATDPDGNVVALDKIFLQGVLYSSGAINNTGNPGVFGSVIAERGFQGTGTFDIYFDVNLRNGLPLNIGNLGSQFRVVMRMNYGEM